MRELVITGREAPTFGGRRFGTVGQYERLTGYAVGELDPADPHDAGIVDLDRASRNARGRVEYRTEVVILRPVDMARGNGWLFYEVINRGNRRCLHRICSGSPTGESARPEDAGTGFLMNEGYTIVWSAWQGDIQPGAGRMTCRLPTALGITGRSREEFFDEAGASTFEVEVTYPAATLDPVDAVLTVRERERDPREMPPGLAFRWLTERRIEVRRPADPRFDRGAIFELVYTARDPIVMGAAFPSVRDVVSHLRFEAADGIGTANPLGAGAIHRAMVFGLSQCGRFVRDFLYQGFNRDRAGRQVFEAAIPIIAGSRKTFVNARWAQPGRYPRQHEDHGFPGDQFPFGYATMTDPVSGRTDGILEACRRQGTVPKLMHVDSESEVWQARASLVATDAAGRDLPVPDEVRLYLLPGMPHGSSEGFAAPAAAHPVNTVQFAPVMRALVRAMREWVEDDRPPPPSAFPSIAAGTWVEPARLAYPAIPGFRYGAVINGLRLADHSSVPAGEGPAYPVLAAAIDGDGNGTAGIRHPLMAAPIATLTGWNPRKPGWAEGELAGVTGSLLPFAETRAERLAAGDPRLSIEERYGGREGWIAALERACAELVAARTLLPEDAERFVTAARAGEDVFALM